MPIRPPIPQFDLRWVPAALVAGLICYWSVLASPPPITGPLELPMTAADAVTRAAFVPATETAWLDRRHAIAYAALALSLEYAFTDRETDGTRAFLLLFCVAVTYGALMEAGQLFRPTRVASMADLASNAVGAGTALALSGLERRP